MCTTKQYFFTCQHTASHRFRNSLCSEQPQCRIRDESIVVQSLCKRCQIHHDLAGQQRQRRRGRSRSPSKLTTQLPLHESRTRERETPDKIWRAAEEDIWVVPRRCFVDIGFRTLDPFGTNNARVRAGSSNSGVDGDLGRCNEGKGNHQLENSLPLSFPTQPTAFQPASPSKPTLMPSRSKQDQLRSEGVESLDVSRSTNCSTTRPKASQVELAECCKKESRYGAVHMRRLEDTEVRFAGRIRENSCISLI